MYLTWQNALLLLVLTDKEDMIDQSESLGPFAPSDRKW